MFEELSRILSSVWMIDRAVVSSYVPAFIAIIEGKFSMEKQPTYEEKVVIPLLENMAKEPSSAAISITNDYDNQELPENSIAVHPIYGVVRSESCWGFSTKQYVRNLIAADNNPSIIAHYAPISTPGGEAHYLDQAAAAGENLKKPIIGHVERTVASAGEYITSPFTRIYLNSRFDRAGSIGTMVSGLDMIPLLEKYGAKYFEAYATDSTMKNFIERQLMDGDPEAYIKEVLDPLNEGFLETMRRNRPGVLKAKEDSGVLNGRMFYAPQAIEVGLIDGIKSQSEALLEAYEMGLEYKNTQDRNKQMSHVLNQ